MWEQSQLFQLSYDTANNVLLTRVWDVFVEEDIALTDKQVARFVARYGPAPVLMDFFGVKRVDVPLEAIVRRAHAPSMLHGQTCIFIASNEPAYSLTRVFAAHQYFRHKIEPILVESPRQACSALGNADLKFEPVQEDDAMLRERTMLGVLTEIDKRGLKIVNRVRSNLRRRAMSTLDCHVPCQSDQAAIGLSDLLNVGLKTMQVTDVDLRVWCPGCRRETRLAQCAIAAARKTSYSCPTCATALVVLTPVADPYPAETTGYSLGGFEVQTCADIRCHGVILPKSG